MGQPAWRVLDRLDDAYEIEDGWCVAPTVTEAQTSTNATLLELANSHGVVSLADLAPLNPNIPTEDQRHAWVAWLSYCGYLIDGDHVVTRAQSVGDRAASILSIVGSSMSSQELLDRLGVERNLNSLKNSLGTDDRFARVDRDRWALTEWGLDAYTGIRALIGSELARSGGRVELDTLVRRITDTHNVTANSVIAYASAPPFQSNHGIVRLADSNPTRRKTPERTRRLYRRGDSWLYRVKVNSDHLRGSGCPAPIAIASILNLQFGQTRQISSPFGTQVISWTGNQPAFGSIRRFLIHEDIEVDCQLFLIINSDNTFDVEQVRLLTHDPLQSALALVGAEAECASPRQVLATAIGLPAESPATSVIGGYRERGDTEIAELLLAAWTEP
ncbi:MAG TPA: hypothetical protein VE196_03455 [Pseudonocardiaceae bacterium]|nr:hypothetical protein [Pseudonocardiaceae bacterium]